MDDKDSELMRYIMVRSMWKLGRHREAMNEAEMAAIEMPDRYTFHYMFAVVALEKGERLEEAYERVRIAAELDPKNEGVKATFAKLSARLGKPAS